MSKYYHDIIRYFFHHQASEEIIDRVQKRILHSQDDADDVMREIWERLDDELLDDADVENAYEQTADTVFGRESHTRSLSWMRIAAIWAVPFLFLCGSMFFYINARQNSDAYDDIAFIHKFTANGERCLITLPDSSKVWLNGGSTLIYPSRFVSAERNVCLSGEAFFDVVKDSRPFIVDVNQIKLNTSEHREQQAGLLPAAQRPDGVQLKDRRSERAQGDSHQLVGMAHRHLILRGYPLLPGHSATGACL